MAVTPAKDIAVGLKYTFTVAPTDTVIDTRDITDFTLPALEAVLVDATDQGNDTGFNEYIVANIKDAGKFTVTQFHHQDIDIWSEIGYEGALVITVPSGTTITCNAILESYTPTGATLNGLMLVEVVFQLSPTQGTTEPDIAAAS